MIKAMIRSRGGDGGDSLDDDGDDDDLMEWIR